MASKTVITSIPQKAYWVHGVIFGGSLYSEWVIIGRNFAFQNGFGLDNKSNSPNSPWAHIREGAFSIGGIFASEIWGGGLIFGTACFWRGLL